MEGGGGGRGGVWRERRGGEGRGEGVEREERGWRERGWGGGRGEGVKGEEREKDGIEAIVRENQVC